MNKIFHENKTCDRKISVFNYGTPGHFSTQEFIRLLQLIKNDEPAFLTLKIVEIIGEDEPHQLDPETIYFITHLDVNLI